MSGQILLVGGLPGSGKTTLLAAMEKEGWLIFDDFKAGAFFDSPRFQNARRFSDLLTSLNSGGKCVVADIDFCNSASRAEAESVIPRRSLIGHREDARKWSGYGDGSGDCVDFRRWDEMVANRAEGGLYLVRSIRSWR
jgi:hypothetical protein